MKQLSGNDGTSASHSSDGYPLMGVESEVQFWNRTASTTTKDFGPPSFESLSFPFAYSSDRKFLDTIGDVDGLSVLEVGSGFGTLGLLLAQNGANVTELDIAPQMVAKSRERSISNGIEADFVAGNAEMLPFNDAVFDMVVGARVIHHFPSIPAFFHEAHRVLKVEGRAVFIEPQKKNPIVEFNRKVLNPERRTKGEHPLTKRDIESAREVFPSVVTDSFYLISPISFLFSDILHSMSLHRTSYQPLQRVENKFVNTRWFRDYCWQVIMTLSK